MRQSKADARARTVLSLVFAAACLKYCCVETARPPERSRHRPICSSKFRELLDIWAIKQKRGIQITSESIRMRRVEVVGVYPGLFRTEEEEYKLKKIRVHVEPEDAVPTESAVAADTDFDITDALLMTQPSSDMLEHDMCCPTRRRMLPYTHLTDLRNVTREVVHAPGRYQYIHEGRCETLNAQCGCQNGSCLGHCYEVSGIQYILVFNDTGHANFEPFSIRSHCACLNLQTST